MAVAARRASDGTAPMSISLAFALAHDQGITPRPASAGVRPSSAARPGACGWYRGLGLQDDLAAAPVGDGHVAGMSEASNLPTPHRRYCRSRYSSSRICQRSATPTSNTLVGDYEIFHIEAALAVFQVFLDIQEIRTRRV